MEKELIQFVESVEDGFQIIHKEKIEVVYDFSCVKYKRTNVLPDSRFFEWISKEEIGGGPPSWAIFFGLVEEVPQFRFEERNRPTKRYMTDDKVEYRH